MIADFICPRPITTWILDYMHNLSWQYMRLEREREDPFNFNNLYLVYTYSLASVDKLQFYMHCKSSYLRNILSFYCLSSDLTNSAVAAS